MKTLQAEVDTDQNKIKWEMEHGETGKKVALQESLKAQLDVIMDRMNTNQNTIKDFCNKFDVVRAEIEQSSSKFQ